MGNPEPNPFFRKQTKIPKGKKKDRCRDSMEAVLTNGFGYVGRRNRNLSMETYEKMKDNSIYIRISTEILYRYD